MLKSPPRRPAFLLAACLLSIQFSIGQPAWESLRQLEGTWQLKGKTSFEQWTLRPGGNLSGEGFRVSADGVKKVTETLEILKREDGSIVYQATVPDQNNGAGVGFLLTGSAAPGEWTFENKMHDFPQKITYKLVGENSLTATVSGPGDAGEKVITFEFERYQSLKGYQILVSSRNTGTVKRFDAVTGEYLGELGSGIIVSETQEVAIGPDGNLYVTALKNNRIMKFDPATGKFLGYFSSGYDLKGPTKMTFATDGFVYVSQWGGGQSSVARFDAKTGRFDRAFTGQVKGPLGHAWDADGNFYLACFFSKEIQAYTSDGKFLGDVVAGGELKGPSNLWFDPQGRLMVTDWEDGNIKRYRKDGAHWVFDRVFAEGFSKLEGITLAPDGYFYGCDWAANTIRKLDAKTGEDLGAYIRGGDMVHPNSLVFWKE